MYNLQKTQCQGSLATSELKQVQFAETAAPQLHLSFL